MPDCKHALRLLALTITACAAITPAAAHASSIFFIRSNDIWVANPDGSGAKQVTTDGTSALPYVWVSAAKGPSSTLAYLRNNTTSTTPRQAFGTINPDGTGEALNPSYTATGIQPQGLYDGLMISIDNAGDRLAWPKSYLYCFYATCNSWYAPYSVGVDGSNEQHIVASQAVDVTFGDPAGQTLLFDDISSYWNNLPATCATSHRYVLIRQTPAPDGGTPGSPTFYCATSLDLVEPALRPDGQAIAAVQNNNATAGTASIVTIPISGVATNSSASPVAQVTSSGTASSPDFSPDGTQIAFEAANSTIDTVPASGGTPAQVLTNATSPAWSPYTLPNAGAGGGSGGGAGGTTGTGGTAMCCASAAQLASLARSAASQIARGLAGRLLGLRKALSLTGSYGERLDVALYLPPARRAADGRAASAKLGTLLAIDVETISAAGRAKVKFALTAAGRRLLAHRRRTRLTLLVLLRDANGHGVQRTSSLTLR